ncbi:MAG: hypothetical protein WKG07_08905 [Hymenobacter sp.]
MLTLIPRPPSRLVPQPPRPSCAAEHWPPSAPRRMPGRGRGRAPAPDGPHGRAPSPNPLVRLGPEGRAAPVRQRRRVSECPSWSGRPQGRPCGGGWCAAAAAAMGRPASRCERELAAGTGYHFLGVRGARAEGGRAERTRCCCLTDVTALRAAEAAVREPARPVRGPAPVTCPPPCRCSTPGSGACLTATPLAMPSANRRWAGRHVRRILPSQWPAHAALAERRKRMFQRAVAQRVGVDWEEEWPGANAGPRCTGCARTSPCFTPMGPWRVVISYGLDVTGRRRAEGPGAGQRGGGGGPAGLRGQRRSTLNPNLIYVRKPQGEVVLLRTGPCWNCASW